MIVSVRKFILFLIVFFFVFMMGIQIGMHQNSNLQNTPQLQETIITETRNQFIKKENDPIIRKDDDEIIP